MLSISFHVLSGLDHLKYGDSNLKQLRYLLSLSLVLVVVYHCGLSASSCGECLDLPTQYNCGWCEDSSSCTTGTDCGEEWLDKRRSCTNPQITSVRLFFPICPNVAFS